jgi:AcrR family transcriptional regulator
MSKAEVTKAKIIQQAAELFNQQGYAGASMSDIMRVTGLQKGGIYNHFESKQELALAAFDFAVQCVSQRYADALKGKRHAVERLQAILAVFQSYLENPPILGGCPLLNTAIDSDDTNPELRHRAQTAMDSLRNMLGRIIQKGIERGEVRPNVQADTAVTIVIAMFEGAMMLSKLYDDPIHLERAIAHLGDYIDHYLRL